MEKNLPKFYNSLHNEFNYQTNTSLVFKCESEVDKKKYIIKTFPNEIIDETSMNSLTRDTRISKLLNEKYPNTFLKTMEGKTIVRKFYYY